MIENINHISDEIIDLDVSGVTAGFRVRRSLLCQVPGSALAAMFSGRHELKKVNGKIFLDRDPEVFKLVVSYLRNYQRLPEIEDKFLKQSF